MPSRSNIQVVNAIEPLDVGEPVPDFHLTNELGQAVSLSDFKGKAFAITFIFTRCPFPTYCPRMTSNFARGRKKRWPSAKTRHKIGSCSASVLIREHDTPAKLVADMLRRNITIRRTGIFDRHGNCNRRVMRSV